MLWPNKEARAAASLPIERVKGIVSRIAIMPSSGTFFESATGSRFELILEGDRTIYRGRARTGATQVFGMKPGDEVRFHSRGSTMIRDSFINLTFMRQMNPDMDIDGLADRVLGMMA